MRTKPVNITFTECLQKQIHPGTSASLSNRTRKRIVPFEEGKNCVVQVLRNTFSEQDGPRKSEVARADLRSALASLI